MTAPAGTVDLSLPDYATLVAQAGVNPDAEAQRVANAIPADVSGMDAAFAGAGGELDAAWSQSMGAQAVIGAAFVNDAAPVLDRDTHVAKLPPEFRDAGTRLAGVARRLDAVATDLTATRQATASAVTGLHTELTGLQQAWQQRVAAAGTQGGLIPQEAIPGLLAERDRIAAVMVTRVTDAGRRVTERIRGYEIVINDALRLLADQGFVPPADLDTPRPPAPAPAGGANPAALGTPLLAGYAADPVNTALGNFVEVETDLAFGGLLAGLTFARTYNSRSDQAGPFGARWSSWASTSLVEVAWTAQFTGPDGQQVSFPRSGAGFGPAVGIHALVERCAAGLSLAWFDGRRWDFDRAGRLLRTWAGPGTGVGFVHDEAGRLRELVHDRGRRILIDWHPERDRIVGVTGSDGRAVRYRYDDAGQLREAAAPAGPRRYAQDEGGRIAAVTDADGVVELVNTYDRDGRVLTQRSPFGRLVTFDYQPDGVTVVADDSTGPRNTYRHDPAGRLLAATDGHGHTQRKRYDRFGNPVEIVGRGGAITRQEFDQRAHLTRRAVPSGAVYSITWDAADRITSVTTSGPQMSNATVWYAYQGAERIPSEITDPEGAVTRFAVADGLVHAITDADGVTIRLRHDADGNLIEARDAAGGVARVERDAAGLPTSVITPAGRRTELRHDQRGLLVQRRDPVGAVWRYEYSAAGRPTATVDPTGARTETRYGSHGEAVELIDALGAVSTRRYDTFGNLAGATAPDGAKWAYTYDALSRLTAWTDPSGGTWLHEYDADGRRTAATDPAGVREDRTFDPMGRLTAIDDGLVTDLFGHDELGRPTSRTRADGSTRHTGYDRCSRRISHTDADGGITRFCYTPAGRLRRITRPTGREQAFGYDGCGRLATWIDGNGERWEHRYDSDGLLVERITPTGLVETCERDAAGRVTRHRRPGLGRVRYTYDPAGRVTAMVDRAGARRFDYDAAGRVVAATDALGHTVRYDYDGRGRLTAITDPLGGRTERGYDELGRLVVQTDPLGRCTRVGYDAAGRPRDRLDPTGTRYRIGYDISGRPAHVAATPPGGARSVAAVERDALGRIVRMTETGATPIELRWDAADRLIERRAGERAIGWSYDADGLRAALHHADGTRTDYTRDAAGRVNSWTHPLLGPVALDRDADGRLLALTGAAASGRWSYTDGWLAGHHTAHGARHRDTRLTRDEHGRVVAEETNGRLRLFGYDQAGQLVNAADSTGERRYCYDPAGRLTGESGPGGERSYRYDEAGRRIAEDGAGHRRRYRWDGFGRLTGVDTDRRSTPVRVDALGELTRADDTPLSWDTGDPMRPLVGHGEDTLVGLGSPWAGTVTGPLDPDWQHTPAGAADPDPWGTAPDGVPLGFRGELALDGLLWLRHRAYDPATRAFLQPDPLSPIAGTAYVGNPYHYAGNDPVNAADPLGQRPVTDADLAGQRDEDGGGSWWSDLGHGVLDVAGLIPVVGETAELVNAGWYALEGDYLMAGLSAAAAIPGLGYGASAAKLAVKGSKLANGTTDAGRLAERAAGIRPPSDEVLFGQRRVGEAFGIGAGRPAHLDGRLISDVSDDLRAGRLSSDDIPLQVFRDPDSGALVSANTRSLAALSDAALRPTNITHIEPTPQLLARLAEPPIVSGGNLPGRSVAVTPGQSDLSILRVIRIPD